MVGTTSGVMAGLILSAFFGIRDAASATQQRSGQVDFFRQLIVDGRRQICVETESIEVAGNVISKEELRRSRIRAFLDKTDSALEGLASRLTYDEIERFRAARQYSEIGLSHNVVFGDDFCSFIFSKIEAVEWLGIESPE